MPGADVAMLPDEAVAPAIPRGFELKAPVALTGPTPYSEINDLIDLVKKTVFVTDVDMYVVQPNGKLQLAPTIKAGQKGAILVFLKAQENTELLYPEIDLRIQGDPTMVEFFSDQSFTAPLPADYEGKPRFTQFFHNVVSGDVKSQWAFFIARRDFAAKDAAFHIGVYATIRPEGHYWTTVKSSN